jgi:hypothetical protein
VKPDPAVVVAAAVGAEEVQVVVRVGVVVPDESDPVAAGPLARQRRSLDAEVVTPLVIPPPQRVARRVALVVALLDAQLG